MLPGNDKNNDAFILLFMYKNKKKTHSKYNIYSKKHIRINNNLKTLHNNKNNNGEK